MQVPTLYVSVTTQGAAPQWAASDVAAIAASVRAAFLEFTYGQVDLVPTVTPFVTAPWVYDGDISHLSLLKVADADAMLAQIGVDPTLYPKRVYLFAPVPASWAGKYNGVAIMNTGVIGTNVAARVAHELGHSYNMRHAASIRVSGNGSKFPPGPTVPSGVTAAVDLTGDPSSTMAYGGNYNHFSAPEKTVAGWMAPVDYVRGSDVTLTLSPIETAGSGVRIPTSGTRIYWAEYRQAVGQQDQFLDPPLRGVQIRMQAFETTVAGDMGVGYTCSALILPSGLQAGGRFDDGQVMLDVVSASPSAAVIRIRPSAAIAPPTTGNTQMLIDTIKADANGLVLGQITQAQIDKIKADVALLVADPVVVVPPPPPPTGVQHIYIATGGSVTAGDGAVWTFGGISSSPPSKFTLRNGQSTGGYGTEIVWTGTKLKVLGSNGGWWDWTGSSWNAGSAP